MYNFRKDKRNSSIILQSNSKNFVNICSKVNVKLSDLQLSKLKSTGKNQTRVTLRMNIKIFEGNNIPHELLSTVRQKLSEGMH